LYEFVIALCLTLTNLPFVITCMSSQYTHRKSITSFFLLQIYHQKFQLLHVS
jgi:hypothetical protein